MDTGDGDSSGDDTQPDWMSRFLGFGLWGLLFQKMRR